MDFVVHGTKGGYKTLFKSNEALDSSLFDIRSDNPPESTIGEKAYAIRSFQNKIIYSKYKIVRDVVGDKRTGFIGFSLFVSKNEKIEPRNILTLVDSISRKYFELYVKNNNLDSLNESWSFIQEIIKLYNPILRPTSFEILRSGLVNDAVAYYNTKDELEKNWQKGFMSHYTKFRQVLFINEDLRGSDKNPLRAIRNSGEVIDINRFSNTTNPPRNRITETPPVSKKPNFPANAVLISIGGLILILLIAFLIFPMDSDRDGDGFSNDKDQCPDTYGLNRVGCPDTDGDGIQDDEDSCPDDAGLPALAGCPDTDGDGIQDDEDSCPDDAGLLALAGCPDTDGDGIQDNEDGCPKLAGPKEKNGCPEATVEINKPTTPLPINNELQNKLRGNDISKKELNNLKSEPNIKENETLITSISLYLNFFEVSMNNEEGEYKRLYKKVKEDEILKESELKDYLKNISGSTDEAQKLRLKLEQASANRLKTLKEFQETIN